LTTLKDEQQNTYPEKGGGIFFYVVERPGREGLQGLLRGVSCIEEFSGK
jgi:hypothetical protein